MLFRSLRVRLRTSARSFVKNPWSYLSRSDIRDTVASGGGYGSIVDLFACSIADDEVSSLSWASNADTVLKYARSVGGIESFHDLVKTHIIGFVAELVGVAPDSLDSVEIPPEPVSSSSPYLS